MPVDPATTTFNTPSIIGTMPRVLRTPGTVDTPSTTPKTTGLLWPKEK